MMDAGLMRGERNSREKKLRENELGVVEGQHGY